MTTKIKSDIKSRIKNFLLVTLGSLIYSFSISFFLDPHKLVPGGVSGIAVIVNHTVGWVSTGVVIIALNIPLLIAGLIKFGKTFLFSTVYSTLLISVSIEFFDRFCVSLIPLTDDILLAACVGGALMAVGIGLVFRGGGTTGGSDIVTKFLRLKYKHLKTGRIFLIVDMFVVLLSVIAFRDIELALYAAVTLFVDSVVLDLVLYGRDGARLVYIISNKSDEIAKELMEKLDLGVTKLDGEGAYTGQSKQVIMCAARKHIFPKIRETVMNIDDMAFMIVSTAQEIFGEGFKNYRSHDL